MAWTDGKYTLVFRFNGKLIQASPDFRRIDRKGETDLKLAVSFHVSSEKTLTEAESLFNETDAIEQEDRSEWNDYLKSVPSPSFPLATPGTMRCQIAISLTLPKP